MATDLINAGMGDKGRLEFILECLQKDKPLYNTDSKYLREKYDTFEAKLEILSGKKKTGKTLVSDSTLDKIVDQAISKENSSKILSSQNKEKSFFARLFSKR